MSIPAWQHILNRGQQTVAVWQQFSSGFTVGPLTLAAHQSNVDDLPLKAQTMSHAQDAVDDARAARDAAQSSVSSLNTRVPRKLDGDLLPDDPFHADLEDIRTTPSDSGPSILTRGQKVVALWNKLNTRNAAASPVVPALLVGGTALAAFQAQVESLPSLQQSVEDKEAALRDTRSALRLLSATVDKNNKRWYAAWEGEFPVNTPANDALSQIDTESGGSNPPTPPTPPTP